MWALLEVGEPFDLGRHVGEPVELGGGQQPVGGRDFGRELVGGSVIGIGDLTLDKICYEGRRPEDAPVIDQVRT